VVLFLLTQIEEMTGLEWHLKVRLCLDLLRRAVRKSLHYTQPPVNHLLARLRPFFGLRLCARGGIFVVHASFHLRPAKCILAK
jgi:hypothetical protein